MMTDQEILKRAKEIRREANERRKQERAERNAKMVAKPVDGKYRIIYADPPWEYWNNRDNGLTEYTGAETYYPTMKLEEICALPVKDWVEDNAVLYLWTTSPLVFKAHKVVEAWGFQYKAMYIWDKVKHNIGYYNSVRHEILLIATRGSCTPEVRKLHDSVVSIERSDVHSQKPEYFRQIIDTNYPTGRRLEMFRRGDAPEGWDVWGNEAK